MSIFFEEIDYQPTPIGPISLRRRHDFRLKTDVLEIVLGDEFLMSDLFTTSEIALATLGLAYHREQAGGKRQLDVVVGGLGLGYTAEAVLQDSSVSSLRVIEALQAIIDWHETGLLPLGNTLCADPRCQFVCSDFFTCARAEVGFDATQPKRLFDAILVDIDHSPNFHLAPENASFYSVKGFSGLKTQLAKNGVFGLWSNDPPDDNFTELLRTVFGHANANRVIFANPYQNIDVTQTIYLAR